MFWDPRKRVSELYESEYLEDYKDIHSDSANTRPAFNEFFKNIPISGGKLFDIGCGNGAFLCLAKEKGFDVFGVDMDSRSVETCKKKGLAVFNSSIEELLARQEEFGNLDIVSFFEVVEHLEEPKNFISEVKKLLKQNGYVVFSCPNRNSLVNFILRVLLKFFPSDKMHKFTEGDFPPHHFTWWSGRSIKYFLSSNNFKDIQLVYIKSKFSDRVDFWRNSIARKIISFLFKKDIYLPSFLFFPLAIFPFGFKYGMYVQAKLSK